MDITDPAVTSESTFYNAVLSTSYRFTFVFRNNSQSARKYSDSLSNPYDTTMAPYQTTVMLDDTRDGQDVVEVQILPQVIVILIRFFFFAFV